MKTKDVLIALKQIEKYLGEKDADYIHSEWLPALQLAKEAFKANSTESK